MNRNFEYSKKLIDDAKKLIYDLENIKANIRRSNNFSSVNFVGRNSFGNFIRNLKVNSINKNLQQAQEKIQKFDSSLILLDDGLSKKIRMPYKLPQFNRVSYKISDISWRIKMRKKQLEIENSINDVKAVLKKLVFIKNKNK
ncbi:MAG: hypothetical protein SOZ89_02760 [Peptoniphilaceae bacterium]|nr:hypothetical protein [Peptoniphilaceae bacterium]MDD7383884.1 hypothetical protein [Peptoniphilaceae bacterium]MDY3738025.1 hypothetical protein [Peptoniphilaceae bacterium]